jgi:hypothetical protein
MVMVCPLLVVLVIVVVYVLVELNVIVLVRVVLVVVLVRVLVLVLVMVLVVVVLVVRVVLVSVALVQVTLTVVMVAVTIFISAGAMLNESSATSMPCDWKTDCRAPVKLAVSLTAAFVASRTCSAVSIGTIISKATTHELEDDRAEAEATSIEI